MMCNPEERTGSVQGPPPVSPLYLDIAGWQLCSLIGFTQPLLEWGMRQRGDSGIIAITLCSIPAAVLEAVLCCCSYPTMAGAVRGHTQGLTASSWGFCFPVILATTRSAL